MNKLTYKTLNIIKLWDHQSWKVLCAFIIGLLDKAIPGIRLNIWVQLIRIGGLQNQYHNFHTMFISSCSYMDTYIRLWCISIHNYKLLGSQGSCAFLVSTSDQHLNQKWPTTVVNKIFWVLVVSVNVYTLLV